MTVNTVAILSPGDMGHSVGKVLGDHGIDVITSLAGRSDRTARLAEAAGIRDVQSLESVVLQADLILSILVPSDALGLTQQVVSALRDTGTVTPFADCNAVSPQTAKLMDAALTSVGAPFIDASIIGPPPGKGQAPRFYVSGKWAPMMSELDGMGIEVRDLRTCIGRASGIKMCYAAMTKGTSALHVALLTAAEVMGLTDQLRAELKYSQPGLYDQMESQIPGLPVKAMRWIGEMEEIADTFDSLGITPLFHRASADVYRAVAETPFAEDTPETVDESRNLAQTIAAIAAPLQCTEDSSR